ncbi:ankyrin repeat-containing domain protein [Fusarium avenaceum]|nr:ankyrin repeat-containing domain protein [Fusarium avenaceum]
MASDSDADWLAEADSTSPLTETDYSYQLATYADARHPGTFNHILESTEYREWVRSSPQTLLFFSEPGAGKSVATSLLIQDLICRYGRNETEARSSSKENEQVTAGMAYIFFDSLRHEEQSYDNIALCISEQLAITRCGSKRPKQPPWIPEPYRTKALCTLSEVCVSRFLEAQIAGHGKHSTVFIILDGLDECPETTRTPLLSLLAKVQRGNISLNVMATWRKGWAPATQFQDMFQNVRGLEIYAREQDLRVYVTQNLPLDLKGQKDLIDEIVAAADGRFLFAKLYLDLLTSSQSSQRLDYAGSMLTLDTNYDSLYAEVMKKIATQTPHRARVAQSCLPWLTFAKRPLSALEIQEALAISIDGNPALGSEYYPVDIPFIISSCGGLARIGCINGTHCIRLINRTTQDYLRRRLYLKENDVAISCIGYLLSRSNGGACQTDVDFEKRLQFNPLYDYAARHWGQHVHSIQTPLLSDTTIRDFLRDRTMWEGALQAEDTAAKMRLKYDNRDGDVSIWYPRMTETIHLATRAGAANLVAALLAKNTGSTFINCQDNDGRTALSCASYAGNNAVLEILLANPHVYVDKRDCNGRTPISYAAENGHALVVSRLLEHGANPDWKDLGGTTPFGHAVQHGHVAVVKVLIETVKLSELSLDQGSGDVTALLASALKNEFHEISEMLGDVDGVDPYACPGYDSTTVLGMAIRNGHESMALKFIDKHGIGQQSDDDQSGVKLLAEAAYIGSTKLVETLLMAYKVDPNAIWMEEHSYNPDGLTPIMLAAQQGHGSVVRLLLDHKSIQLDATHGCGTALSLAAANGHRDILEMLMADGRIDINQTSEDGNTSLHLAASVPHKDVVQALLRSDTINMNSQDYFGRTPLLAAAGAGLSLYGGKQRFNDVAVGLVSDARVDVNCRDNGGYTPLYWAAQNGLAGLIEAILNHVKADIGLEDEEEAICVAIDNGHTDVVKAFLKSGRMDINNLLKNERGHLEGTLLSIAAYKGMEDIVDLLLSKPDIEPHKPDARGRTSLAMAAFGGSVTIVEKLLKINGADPNSRDLLGRTPLHMVVQLHRPMGTIQALLQAKDIDPDPVDNEGRTPLSILCGNNNGAMLDSQNLGSINLLLACSKVNPNSKDALGRTPFTWAVEKVANEVDTPISVEMIRGLLQIQTVDPNIEDGEGLTPLLRAIRGNHANEMVRVLLEREDLDVNHPSRDGLTPIAFASKIGDAAVASILRKNGALEVEFEGPVALEEENEEHTAAFDSDTSASDAERVVGSQILSPTGEESADSQSSSQRRGSSGNSERSMTSYQGMEVHYQLSRSIVLPLYAPSRVTLEDSGDMCERCSAIDLEDAFSIRSTDKRGRVIAELGKLRTTWMARDCPMCRLIAAMASRLQLAGNSDAGDEDGCHLVLIAVSSTGTWLCENREELWQHFLHPWIDTMLLTLVPTAIRDRTNTLMSLDRVRSFFGTGFIGRLGSNCEHGTRSISIHRVDAKVDYAVAKEWITCCREEHSARCNTQSLVSIPHFWLIDCTTRQIVEQGEQVPLYAALSYVWGLPAVARSGNKDQLELSDNRIPEGAEAVVEDAMKVALGLGYRFLWVDRYCVLQDGDIKIKREQLQSMDLVYANADVTLVGTAGQTSSAGLPGVCNERPRVPQPCVKTKDHALSLIAPDPATQIKSSAWMTRGWTYQEGLLSRRRLFFSETEMSFECADLVAREAMRLPSVVQRAMCHRKLRIMRPSWVYSERKLISRLMGGNDLFNLLADYTRRKLTYEHDALNAMLGVLRVFAADEQNPIYHVCGVPIIRDPQTNLTSLLAGIDVGDEDAGIALLGFVSGLCWTFQYPGVRRPGFPSWSWTGWDGVVNHWRGFPMKVSFAEGFEVEVSIVVPDGFSSIHWNDYYNRLRNAFARESRSSFAFSEYHRLDITANVTMVRFYRRYYADRDSIELRGTVSIGNDIWEGEFEPDHKHLSPASGANGNVTGLQHKLLEDTWLGIVLGEPSEHSQDGYVYGSYVLVLREIPSLGDGGTTQWERVGLLKIFMSRIESGMLERRTLRLI